MLLKKIYGYVTQCQTSMILCYIQKLKPSMIWRENRGDPNTAINKAPDIDYRID